MNNTTREQLRKLATLGFKLCYGAHPDKQALLRLLCELRRIDVAGYAGYYLMAYIIFNETAHLSGIKVWPRGAVASSIVCHIILLTKMDPLRYGLHSARFVNEEPPRFQFDIEEARFDEFKEKATKVLKNNPDILDYESGCKYLLGDLQSSSYLNGRIERPIPNNIDDEIAEYALSFPGTMTLYETYKERKNGATWTPTGITKLDEILAPTYGLLAYQEQMFDIMKLCFNVHGTLPNKVRLSIQRGETEQIKAYRIELQENAKQVGLGDNEFDTAWSVLTSNPKAFLKAHAVSRVVSRFFYNQ
jgi:DNA polymerase III alpha subunit